MGIPDEFVEQRIRVMQIVSGALIAATVTFAAVVLIVVELAGPLGGVRDADNLPILSLVAAVMLATCIPMGFILPNVLLRNAVQQIAATTPTPGRGAAADSAQVADDEARLLGVKHVATIISSALFEASGLLACIAYLNEGVVLTLGGAVIAALLMLWQFPTRERVRDWLRRHLDLVTELRALGGLSGPP
jgi:hypothetical protein